jgi:hypothetical protein
VLRLLTLANRHEKATRGSFSANAPFSLHGTVACSKLREFNEQTESAVGWLTALPEAPKRRCSSHEHRVACYRGGCEALFSEIADGEHLPLRCGFQDRHLALLTDDV